MQRLRHLTYRLLRGSERYTKTDMVYFVGGGFWLSVGQAATSLTAFATAIVYANILSQETYGTYKFVIALAGIVAAFTAPGMNLALTRSVARGFGGSVRDGARFRMYGGIIGAIVTLGIAGYYYFQGNFELALSVLIIAIFLPFFDSYNVFSSFFQGRKEFQKDAYYSTAIQIISALATIGGVFITESIPLLILIYFGSYTLLRALAYWSAIIKTRIVEPRDPEMVRYGLHLSLVNVLNLVAVQIDKILLFHFLGPVEVAIYAIATSLPDHLKSFVRNTANLAAPKYAKLKDPSDIQSALSSMWRKMAIFSVVVLVGIGIYALLSPLFFRIVFPDYLASITFSQVYALVILSAAVVLPAALIQYQAKVKEMYILNTINYLVQIAFLFIFIPLWGIWGAVLARVISFALNEAVTVLIVILTFKHKAEITLSEKL